MYNWRERFKSNESYDDKSTIAVIPHNITNDISQNNETETTNILMNLSREDIINNWSNSSWPLWHRPTWEADGRPTNDAEYLGQLIKVLPAAKENLCIDICDLISNYSNKNWWIENINTIITLFDKMYLKKGATRSGVYYSWFTRCTLFIDTFMAESQVAAKLGINLDVANHSTIHAGIATSEEAKPDFSGYQGNHTMEMKLVKDATIDKYLEQLRTNFMETKRNGFHNADFAVFVLRNRKSKYFIYSLLDQSIPLVETGDIELVGLVDYDGQGLNPDSESNRAKLPRVPYPLLFGFGGE